MIQRTQVGEMKIKPTPTAITKSTMPSTNTITNTTPNTLRKTSTGRCDTSIRDIIDIPSDGECSEPQQSNIFGLNGSNYLDSLPGTGDFTFINESSCSASSCDLDESTTESVFDKAVNTEVSNTTKQVSLAAEPILHVSTTPFRTLFEYEDHEILNMVDSESVDKLFKYIYNYKAPATLAEHQMPYAHRIPKIANILVFGKTGHGKSSFINTVEKCLGSKMWPRAKLGSRAKPGTEELVMYDITKNINFIDTRGQVSFGASENEELYQVLSSSRPMGHQERDVDKTSTLLNKYKHKVKPHNHDTPPIHLAVLVVSKDVTDEELVGISNFIESLSMMKLKVVAILTKVDLIPPKARDDEVVQLTNRLLSIGVAKVCPVSNLPATGNLMLSETSRKQILVAMKHILSCFETYTYQYDNQQNDTSESAWCVLNKGFNVIYLLIIVFMLMIAMYVSVASLCTLLQRL